jgi:hypothetical protein
MSNNLETKQQTFYRPGHGILQAVQYFAPTATLDLSSWKLEISWHVDAFSFASLLHGENLDGWWSILTIRSSENFHDGNGW